MKLYLSPRSSYNSFSFRYLQNEIFVFVSKEGIYFSQIIWLLIWMRILLNVSSLPSRVSSITPLGPLLHQPTAYWPKLTLFESCSVKTQPLEFVIRLLSLSNYEGIIDSTLNPVLLTSKSKGMISYLPVLWAACLNGSPLSSVTANLRCQGSCTCRGSSKYLRINFFQSLPKTEVSQLFLIICDCSLRKSILRLFILTTAALWFYTQTYCTPNEVHSIQLDSFMLAYSSSSMQYIFILYFTSSLSYFKAKAECVNPLLPTILTF